ncbi:sterol desaturase family protein [Evansella cellulosilytica]|uniref:Fatty acid hydroxylase n=1 Tax=Evansella cellulosilytica (strain ATCC 21833 / DSM 2522 / FERM P-1141 / JCM 9156 / N-4) TaxID=649639 RepID=E6TUV6_EVAC2|nr:sterol desaturase family protein [Evansella cellulosilytica]ADU32108.1 fatty acid hydroxylase [Evansella cellulosilytica DSM 2522]
MFESVLNWLMQASWKIVIPLLLLLNVVILLSCIVVGNKIVQWFYKRRIAALITTRPSEVFLALLSVILNTAVTVLGYYLWKNGVIVLSTSFGFFDWIDILILLLIMDFAMYVFHRFAHLRFIYPLIHRTHHRYEDPRPITLFALNPLENLGFGLLWIIVLTIYPASWIGISGYLFLNVVFGLIGHLGVEPFPNSWVKHPILKWISTSTYHAQHHQQEHYNYGFYTIIWDRLFGTLSPKYPSDFGNTKNG